MLRRYCGASKDSAQKIAEVGCGSGYLLSFLEQWFPQSSLTGFDYDQRLLDEARKRTKRTNLVQGNAEELPFPNSEFDALVSLHLIEHLYHPELMISEVNRVLKPGGIFILATPNLKGWCARIMGDKWGGFRDDHVSLKSPDQWAALLSDRSFLPLQEHTTFLSGIPAFRTLPLGILNWGLLLLFCSLPWKQGEAYIAVWRKPQA